MKNNQKVFKIFFLLCVFYISAVPNALNAQNIKTYYTFAPDTKYVWDLNVDASGNFYYIDYDENWHQRISKISSNGIVSTVLSDKNILPRHIALDNAGNVFFSDENKQPAEIKKINPDGTVSSYASGNLYPEEMTFNPQGQMYFTDRYDYPNKIKKVNPDGTVSTILGTLDYYPQFLDFDKSGTLYFPDQQYWPTKFKKMAPDETVSDFVSGFFRPQKLRIDTAGNLFFIDTYPYPYELKKVTADGTVSVLAKLASSAELNSLTVDQSGNLYFIARANGQITIMTIQNPSVPCATVPPPNARDTAICYGNTVSLSTNGFGEVRWYDAPTGGNLINTGVKFTTGAITTTTSFYIESYFCNEVTARTELKVTVNPPPTITITGNTRSIDSVTLTASGGTSFLWSGGTSKTTAQNTFTTSGTYTVTVQKEGCVNTASVEVTTNVAGINKYGNLLSDRNDNLNKYGAAGTETKVDRYGKIYDNGDGNSATNNGLAFDGINDFVTAPSAVYFKGDLTIECWVYPRSFGNWARIIDFGNGAGNNNVLLAYSFGTSGAPGFHINGGQFQANKILSLNAWSHIAATLNGNIATIYINGVASGTYTLPVPANLVRNYCYIGKSNWAGDPTAHAVYDELRIWNVARTSAEIQASMSNDLMGNETGLVAYYNFNQGIPSGNNAEITTIADQSGNSHYATLNNFSLNGNTSNWVNGAPVFPYSDGSTAAKASSSAFAIKQSFPNAPDGFYWIKNNNINGGVPFQIYADMTTDGGGWTLIMCNKSPNSGWTNANAVLRNQTTPTNDGNYSIIAWADYIKKSGTGFQYMMDAHTRGNYGGIWTANQPYSFVSRSNGNTDITINTKFGNWNHFEGGGFGPRMPWWTHQQTSEGFITTSLTGTSHWWGTLIAGNGWGPSPWLSGENGTLNMQAPGVIWYWVR